MTTTDIGLQGDVAALDQLPAEQREVAITGVLSQARDWLARAEVATDPAREVSNFKAFIATVAETSKQLGLSKEIKQDAEVMVRRAERSLGKAIREGQERGEIRKQGERSPHKQDDVNYSNNSKREVTEFASRSDLSNSQGGIYDVTDDVTDDEFEDALTEAQEESNVSRSNVVRKIKERKTSEEKEDLWAEVEKLIKRGMTSDQINSKLEMYAEARTLRAKAKDRGITFPADKIASRSKFNTKRALDSLAGSLNVTAMTYSRLSFEDITQEEAVELLERIESGYKATRQIIKSLKEITK